MFRSRRYNFDVGTVRPNLRALLAVPSNRQHVLTRHHRRRNAELVGNQRVVWITPTAKEGKEGEGRVEIKFGVEGVRSQCTYFEIILNFEELSMTMYIFATLTVNGI